MTAREIQGHLRELYGIEVSPDLISVVTDAVLEQVAEWQNRPLDALYALVLFDALRVKIRDEGTVRNKAVYLALGVRPDGTKEILGLWIEQTEGAKFWLRVMNELRNRGVADMLIAIVDGLKGFPEAISAVFPEAQIQTCIVHLIRHSLAFASWKERRDVAAALKPIYRAANAEIAREQLEGFAAGHWGKRYPAIAPAWRRQWEQVVPFFAFPIEVRKIIYTRMRSTSFSVATCYSCGARVTARQSAGSEDASPAAQPLASLLICGARAPRSPAWLPVLHEPLVGMFGVTREVDLPIAKLLDVVGVRRAPLVALLCWRAGLQLHRPQLVGDQRWASPLIIDVLG
jgi:hypothetical protein